MLKKKILKFIRKKLKLNKYQNITSTIIKRCKIKIQKLLFNQKYNSDDFIKTLSSMGIKKGDNIMIHCSYEELYNYTDNAADLINKIIELVGDCGTVFMPSYGDRLSYFDVNYSPSMAGLLSEVFRRKEGVVRSIFPNFAIAAYGPLAEEITKTHIYSKNGFDDRSPYFKFSQIKNSKVILLGLGKKSIYLSVLHCADWLLRDKLPYYNKLLSNPYSSTVIDYEGVTHNIEAITRVPKSSLHRTNIRKIYKEMPSATWMHKKVSNVDIVVYEAGEALRAGISMAHKGISIYKKPKPLKKLFIPYQRGVKDV